MVMARQRIELAPAEATELSRCARAGAGDSIYHDGDCEHGYRNDAGTPCTYYIAMDVAGGAGR
jgi:hypothetical protein